MNIFSRHEKLEDGPSILVLIELGFPFLNSIPLGLDDPLGGFKSSLFFSRIKATFLSSKRCLYPSIHYSIYPLEFGTIDGTRDEFFIRSARTFLHFFSQESFECRSIRNGINCVPTFPRSLEVPWVYFGHRRRYFPYRNGSFPSFCILQTLFQRESSKSSSISIEFDTRVILEYPRIFFPLPPPLLKRRILSRILEF